MSETPVRKTRAKGTAVYNPRAARIPGGPRRPIEAPTAAQLASLPKPPKPPKAASYSTAPLTTPSAQAAGVIMEEVAASRASPPRAQKHELEYYVPAEPVPNKSYLNKVWSETIREAVMANDGKKLKLLANALILKACGGDTNALKEIGERLDGKSIAQIEAKIDARISIRVEDKDL